MDESARGIPYIELLKVHLGAYFLLCLLGLEPLLLLKPPGLLLLYRLFVVKDIYRNTVDNRHLSLTNVYWH
jgi:hypothetical protein